MCEYCQGPPEQKQDRQPRIDSLATTQLIRIAIVTLNKSRSFALLNGDCLVSIGVGRLLGWVFFQRLNKKLAPSHRREGCYAIFGLE